MHSRTALNYSMALVELAKDKNILPRIKTAVEELLAALNIAELRHFLSHPRVPVAAKREIFNKVLAPETPLEFRNFLNLLIDRRKDNLLIPILENAAELALKAEGYQIVELISALPLTAAAQTAIQTRLEKCWETKVFAKYRENPNLIGGIIIRRGDEFIDGSLAGQLNALKELLLAKTNIGSLIP